MYGLVNTALRDLVVDEHGPEAWRRVRTRAGFPCDTFVAMEQYPDAVTYDLVAAACEELGASNEALLEAFGERWITYTVEKGHGDVLEFAGRDFEGFLEHLDDMHARISLSFPELDPPSFDLEVCDDGRLALHYHSERPGLAPMVVGLLNGLGKRFDKALEIEIQPRPDGGDHDLFLIRVEDAVQGEAA